MTVYNNATKDEYAPSWQDISLKSRIYGGKTIEISDIKGLTLNTSIDIGQQRATGGVVVRRTTGSENHTGAMNLYRRGWIDALEQMVKVAPFKLGKRRIGGIHFDLEVQHSFPGESRIYTMRVKGCRVAGREYGPQEGNDPDTVNIPLSIADIVDVINGEEVGIR